MKNKKKKSKISLQKIFIAISIGFFLACCLFYGTRLIKLYLENEKKLKKNEDALANIIINENQNKETFKKINNNYYFNGDANNNYIIYSNILWRIVKVNNDNTIKLISEDPLTYLAYENKIDTFKDSYISKWLNNKDEQNSGILIKELDNKYLVNDKVCLDKITKANNQECKKYEQDLYISLLSLADYMNAGGSKSYLNNEKKYYLSSINDNKVWYVNNTGKAEETDGKEFLGIRPTITLGASTKQNKGTGKKDDPYLIDTDIKFGSYVKLKNDLYRIYETSNDTYKLSLNTILKDKNTEIEEIYSKKSYYYNDTDKDSLAFYLNNTLLNKLTYKNKIINNKWSNGIINDDLDYTKGLETKIETKIATLSIGNILLNDQNGYILMNGNSSSTKLVYKVTDNGKIETTDITDPAYIIPTISINQDILTKGKGTLEEPYEMEE